MRTLQVLPDTTGGYALPFKVSVLKPLNRINVAENPSVETNLNGWELAGSMTGSIVRDSSTAWSGAYSLQWSQGDTDDYLIYDVNYDTSNLNIGLSISIKGPPGNVYLVGLYTVGGSISDYQFRTEIRTNGGWQRISAIGKPVGHITPSQVFVSLVSGSFGAINVDALLIEVLENNNLAVSDFFDGDSVGFVSNRQDFFWYGQPHASMSERLAQSRAGGQESFLSDLPIHLVGMVGLGMSPNTPVLNDIGRGQLSYQDSFITGRSFTLLYKLYAPSGVAERERLRKELETLFKPNLVYPPQPVVMRFYFDECGNTDNKFTPLEIRAVYRSGLEGLLDNLFQENLSLTFEAWDVSLRELSERGVELEPNETISTKYIIYRTRYGTFAPLSGSNALDDAVRCIAISPRTRIKYVGGSFNGGAAEFFSYWDEDSQSWLVPVPGSEPTAEVLTLSFDAQGKYLYGGGLFVTIGGITKNRIFRLDTINNTYSALGPALSPGANDAVNASLVDYSGRTWFAGKFTSPFNRVMYRNATDAVTDSFQPAGPTGLSTEVFCLATDRRGYIYAGHIGGISRFDGNDWGQIGALDPGKKCLSLKVHTDGRLYATGNFEEIDGEPVSRAAVYNGVGWRQLGNGLPQENGRVIGVDTDGLLAFRGDFPQTVCNTPPCPQGGPQFLAGNAKWNGTIFVLEDIQLSSIGQGTYAAALDVDGTVYLGLSVDTPATCMYVEDVTNPGTEEAEMTWIVTGPGTLYRIANLTTRKSLFCNCYLAAGERAVIRFSKRGLYFNSQFRQLNYTALPGSQTDILLQTGKNTVGIYFVGTPDLNPYLYYRVTHNSLSGGAL